MSKASRKGRVLVLAGGVSGEHSISLRSAATVVAALEESGYETTVVGIAPDGRWLLGNVRELLERARTSLMLAAVLAVIALALSLVGLYSVLSFGVARRMREFGIWIALGASPGSVRRLVLAEGLTLTAIGAIVGLFGGVVVVQLARTMISSSGADDVRPYVACTRTGTLNREPEP